jgi:hypothetical protein
MTTSNDSVTITSKPRGTVSVSKVIKNTVVVNKGSNAVDAAGSGFYSHTQNIPAAQWVVNHTLNFNPSVTIVSTSGDMVHGDVTYPGPNQVILNFSAPFSGKAYLS